MTAVLAVNADNLDHGRLVAGLEALQRAVDAVRLDDRYVDMETPSTTAASSSASRRSSPRRLPKPMKTNYVIRTTSYLLILITTLLTTSAIQILQNTI